MLDKSIWIKKTFAQAGVLLLLTINSPTVFAQPLFTINTKPPKGFEQVPHRKILLATISFLHCRIGQELIEITSEDLRFLNPEKVVNKIEALCNKKIVLDKVNQRIPSIVFIKTHHKKDAILEYSYNKKNNSIDIIVSKKYLNQQSTKKIVFLPKSTEGFSATNQFNAVAAASHSQEGNQGQSYSLINNNIFAYKNSRLYSNILVNKADGKHSQIQFINFYGQTDYYGKQLSYGFLTSAGGFFFPSQNYLGVNYTTDTDMVTNKDVLTASPLQIFVPSPAQVTVYANNQLVYSSYLQSGYRTIDTNNFPSGAYDLDIHIGSSETHQYFVKTSKLPPVNFTQYHISAGYLTKTIVNNDIAHNELFPDILSTPVADFGASHRISKHTAVHFDFLLSPHDSYFTAGPSFAVSNFLVDATGLVGRRGEHGAKVELNWSSKAVFGSLIALKLFNVHKQAPQNAETLDSTNLLTNTQTLYSGSMGYMLTDNSTVNLLMQYNKNIAQHASYSYGADYKYQFYLPNSTRMSFNLSYNHSSNEGNTIIGGVTLYISNGNLSGNETLALTHVYNRPDSATYNPGLVGLQGNLTYSHQDNAGIGYAASLTHNISSKQQAVGATYQYTNTVFNTNLYANLQHQSHQTSSYYYGGSIASELVWTPEKMDVNGTKLSSSAGVLAVVHVPDSQVTKHTRFKLLNSNYQSIATLEPNRLTYIPIEPYQMQNFHLSNESDADFHVFTHSLKPYVFYPGNIAYLNYKARKKLIIFGRLVGKSRKPLAYADIMLDNQTHVDTDESGYFQLEAYDKALTFKVILANGKTCRLHLKLTNSRKNYVYLSDVICD